MALTISRFKSSCYLSQTQFLSTDEPSTHGTQGTTCFFRGHSRTRSKGGSLATPACVVTADGARPSGCDFQQGHAFRPRSQREERRADESRALTLPFKSLFAAPLTARIDLALPWIHPGRQLQRMHKAHCSQHANSHTSKHTHAHTNTVQNTDTGESVVLSHTYRHACTHTDNEWTPSPS